MTQPRNAIFIHSLWRSGSTYFFDKFRRSQAGYFAYQEPMHETMLSAVTDRNLLLEVSAEVSGTLRHPELSDLYYAEAFQTYDSWRGMVRKSFIYDGYFVNPLDADLRQFLVALILAAPRKPVIQECRTSARIGAIKDSLGGRHLYIWRNPRDQWWSLKINIYFDVVLQMILNADPVPHSVAAFRNKIGFRPFHATSIGEEQAHFCRYPLSARDGYTAFFLLWCLAWIEGDTHADIASNLDMLSVSVDYRRSTEKNFADKGIEGLTFADCHMHRAPFTRQNIGFFERIEMDVYALLAEHGTSADSLAKLQEARRHYAPGTQQTFAVQIDSSAALEALERTRAIYLRLEDDRAAAATGHEIELSHVRAESVARERALEEELTAMSDRMQADLARVQREASMQLIAKDEQLSAKEEQLARQIALVALKTSEFRELQEVADRMKADLGDRLNRIETLAGALTAQCDHLTLRNQQTEMALAGLLDQFRAAAEEADRLHSSWIMRVLAKLRLLRLLAKQDVPSSVADAIASFAPDTSRPGTKKPTCFPNM